MSTVSRVLSGRPDVSRATRERVQELIRLRRFSPNNNAQRLKQQESRTVAIIVKGTSNALFSALLEQLQPRVEQAGCTAAVVYLDEEGDELQAALQACRESHPCGMLFLGAGRSSFSPRFSEVPVPAVLLTSSAAELPFGNLSSVCTDDERAAEAAMDLLLERGHREVAVIGGSLSRSDPSRRRFLGCRRSMERHGLAFDEATRYEEARFSLGSAYQAMQRLLARMPGLSAVFCMSDLMAIGAVRAVFDSGRQTPGDISVIGFDGIELSQYCVPKLTTVRQDVERLAARGVELLLEAMASPGRAVHETIPFSILPGESVAWAQGSGADPHCPITAIKNQEESSL